MQDEDQRGTPLIDPSATLNRCFRHLFPEPFFKPLFEAPFQIIFSEHVVRHLFPAPIVNHLYQALFQKMTVHTPANQVLMNVECYRRAVKMTIQPDRRDPDRRVPVGRQIKNGKGVYLAKYYKLGTTGRQEHEEIGRVFRAARMAGVPESEWPPVPMSYVLARPTEVLLGDLNERLIQTVAQQKPDF